MKQTKIVATIGPASADKDILRKMIESGMNVARLNFSHGRHEWHGEIINRVRELSHELNTPIGIIADLQGPRVRTLVAEDIPLKKGERVRVSDMSHKDKFSELSENVSVPTIFLDASEIISGFQKRGKILIEDGLIELTVTEIQNGCVMAEAAADYVIQNHKGVILPGIKLNLPILSEKDLHDLEFVLGEEVDFVALSFVGSPADIENARAKIREMVGEADHLPQIIAKIERAEAVKNLSAIVGAADAIMVARGDLGIEMPESEVVILQKHIIAESLKAAKPVIVATQMMKSMTENLRPTRAEVSDVSNAVIDHADALMLSEESAAGKYPVETIAMMAEIIEKTEESPFDDLYAALEFNFKNDYAVMVRSVYELAQSFSAKAILLLSMSGFTARLLSHFRPKGKLFVATNSRATWNELSLVWGVDPYLFENDKKPDTFIDRLSERVKNDQKLCQGDKVVVFLGRRPDEKTMRLVGVREIK